MDLGWLINRTATTIKKNWLLLLPPILTQVVLPSVLLAVAAFTVFPLGMAYALIEDFWGALETLVGGVLVLVAAGFLVDTFVTAGWAYMNKRAVVDGHTRLDDLLFGAKRYFLPILGGRLLVGAVMLVPLMVAIGAFVASIASLDLGPSTIPGALTPLDIVGLLGPLVLGLIGILLIVGAIEIALYMFLLPWMQALVVDELSVWQSIKSSVRFVWRNFVTMVGYVVLSAVAWVVTSWMTSLVLPGASYSQFMDPEMYANGSRFLTALLGPANIVYTLTSSLLAGFFTLLLFAIYVDRTRETPRSVTATADLATPSPQAPQTQPVRGQLAPRGMRYCVNCGAMVISLAVFCPNCGARQPPLGPE